MRNRWFAALAVLAAVAHSPAGAQGRVVELDTLRVQAASRAGGALAAGTRAVEVVTAEQIRRSPASTVADVLQWALGVDLMPRSPALVDVALRGSSFEQVLVLVDGVRVSDAQTGHFDLNLAVPLEQVERVEVLRGAASALHGADAVGGVINIVTRREGAGTVARAEGGSDATAGLALAHARSLGGARLDMAGDLRRSDGHRDGTDYRVATGRLALTAPLAGGSLRSDVGVAARDFGAQGFYGPFPAYEETRAATASVAWRADAARRLSLEPTLSARLHRDHFVLRRHDPDFYRNQHETLQLGGELTGRYALTPALRAAAGVEGYQDRLRSERLGDRDESRGAAFAELAAGQAGRAVATAGVRGDWHQRMGVFWSPSLSAAWWPAAPLRLRASAGRAFRAPTWTERFYRDPANIGTPELAPERAWSAEAGAELRPVAGVRLGLTAFMRQADDLIDWARPADRPTEPWRTRNVVEARFRGVEAEAGAELARVRWTARGSWLSVRSDDAPGFTSKYALRPLVEQLSLAAEHAPLSGVDLSLRAMRARRSGEGAYLLVDARAAYSLPRARLFLDLRNVLDEQYVDIVGLAAPGRALLLGAELHTRR